jgi:hypothetical protein
MHDACLSAFAMMCFQDASTLEFQGRLQEQTQMNNLQSFFPFKLKLFLKTLNSETPLMQVIPPVFLNLKTLTSGEFNSIKFLRR